MRVFWGALSTSVSPRGLVDSYVVNAYAMKLSKDVKDKVYFLKTWVGIGVEETYQEATKKSFAFANDARPLHKYDLLYFPALYKHHWFVLVVDLNDKSFVFLDSIYGEEDNFYKEVPDLMIPRFIHAWTNFGYTGVDFWDFKVKYPVVPKQTNNRDCGIFAMKCMELWNPRVQMKDLIRPQDIHNIRKQIARDLLLSKHNSTRESIELVYNFNETKHGLYAGQARPFLGICPMKLCFHFF
uniref:Ubiquitin-like protease family profile domain-containing protein n=1 Tax=Leersia perrieri TaxID=77586 RepID=A0A0D9WVL3_9ORYZ